MHTWPVRGRELGQQPSLSRKSNTENWFSYFVGEGQEGSVGQKGSVDQLSVNRRNVVSPLLRATVLLFVC